MFRPPTSKTRPPKQKKRKEKIEKHTRSVNNFRTERETFLEFSVPSVWSTFDGQSVVLPWKERQLVIKGPAQTSSAVSYGSQGLWSTFDMQN